MNDWYMLTVVGQDRPGIVAQVTSALYRGGCNLGEASMLRLGGNFTIMLMVQQPGGGIESLETMLQPVAGPFNLHCHLDKIEGRLHEHVQPDVRVTVFGADRAGIVAGVTSALAEAGMNILDLESDVAGSSQRPIYVMHMEGSAAGGIEALEKALAPMAAQGIDVRISPIETMMG